MFILLHYASSDSEDHEAYGPFGAEAEAEVKKQSLIEELTEGDDDADIADYEEDFEVLELKSP